MKFGSELARGLLGPRWRGGRGSRASLVGRGLRPGLCSPGRVGSVPRQVGSVPCRGPQRLRMLPGTALPSGAEPRGLVGQVAGEPSCPSRSPQSRVMLVAQLGRHMSQ